MPRTKARSRRKRTKRSSASSSTRPGGSIDPVTYIAVQIRIRPIAESEAKVCACFAIAKHAVRVVMPDQYVFRADRCDICLQNWIRGRRYGTVT